MTSGFFSIFNPRCTTYTTPGAVEAVYDDLVLLATSGYEEVMFLEPISGEPVAGIPLLLRLPW